MELKSRGRKCTDYGGRGNCQCRSSVRSSLPRINLDFNLIADAALLFALSPSPFLIPVLSLARRFLSALPSSETELGKLNIICDVRKKDINPLKRRRRRARRSKSVILVARTTRRMTGKSPLILVRTQLSFCLLSRFRQGMRGGSEQASVGCLLSTLSVPVPQLSLSSIQSFPLPFFRVPFALHCRIEATWLARATFSRSLLV